MTGCDRYGDDAAVDRVRIRVQSILLTGVAYAYGSRYPLPRHDDWHTDDDPDSLDERSAP